MNMTCMRFDPNDNIMYLSMVLKLISHIYIQDSKFESNVCSNRGGAITFIHPQDVVLKNNDFTNNIAYLDPVTDKGSGGALYFTVTPVLHPRITIDVCRFSFNTADVDGLDIYIL